MRWCAALAVAATCLGQSAPPSQSAPQQPHYQSNWPCTGKQRSFDPTYSRLAEATGGHLLLLDPSEAGGFSALALGDMKHGATIIRAAGKIDSFIDIPFWVDSGVESLFVVATLQCMQTMYLYDPQRAGIDGKVAGVEDNWYRAGRIATVPNPQPGSWALRLLGTGPYFVAVQAKSSGILGSVDLAGNTLSVSLDASVSDPVFRLVNAAGEFIQPLALTRNPDSPSQFAGTFDPPPMKFRVQAEWRRPNGDVVWRTDPRLQDPKLPISAK